MRWRGAFATVPLVLLLWLGIGAYLFQRQQAGLDTAEHDSHNLTHAFEENIRRTIEAVDTTSRTVRAARALDPAHFDLAAWERDSGLSRDLALQISLADRTGEVLATSLSLAQGRHVNIADRAHFRMPRDSAGDELFISQPVVGRISGRWSVQVVRKLFTPDGAFDGVIVASLDPAFLARFYRSLDIGQGALLLLGQDGIVRSAAPSTVAALGADLSGTTLMAAAGHEPNGTVRMAGQLDGVERILSWRRVDPYGLLVVVGLPTATVLRDFRHDMQGSVGFGLVATLLTLLAGAVLDKHRREIVQSREMLSAAVENINQGLLVVDARRRVTVMNARAAELLELPPHLARADIAFDDLLEWQITAGEFAGQDADAVRALVRSGGITQGNSVYNRTRANGVVLEIRTKTLATGLAVRTYTDITEQQHTAKILADARDAAEAAARAKSEFLAVMSHEIRTPLNGVIGVADLLEDLELGPLQLDYVRTIRQSGDHLLELVNDILDYSRLEAGRMELEAVDFDAAALMRGVVNMLRTQAEAKCLDVTATTSGSGAAMVCGDPAKLRQILLNLTGNAVKFTQAGSVHVTLAHTMTADSQIRLLFSVADSGIGIAPDAIEEIFQEFTQMDGSISRRFGGSGLGLAICRRLVTLMGGSIRVESKPGLGSVFSFDVILPAATTLLALAEPEAAVNATGQAGLHVLVAEDNPTNRLVALRLLEKMGHTAEAVENGLEAVTALAEVRYDLILMDIMMPEMDGLTATRHIRGCGREWATIPIIGLTAGSSDESLAACLTAGMNAVTTKPVTLPRLRAAILDGLATLAQTSVVAADAPASRLRELADMLGDDAVREIVATFAEDTRANLETMRRAAQGGESQVVYRCAHSVAGAANNVGATALANLAATLERTVGSLSAAQVDAAIVAMQAALEMELRPLSVEFGQLA